MYSVIPLFFSWLVNTYRLSSFSLFSSIYVIMIADARVLSGIFLLEFTRIFSSSFFTSFGSQIASPCPPTPVYLAIFSSNSFLLVLFDLAFFSAFTFSSCSCSSCISLDTFGCVMPRTIWSRPILAKGLSIVGLSFFFILLYYLIISIILLNAGSTMSS